MFVKLFWVSLLMHASLSFAQSEPMDFLVPEVSSVVGEPIEAQINLGQLDARYGRVSAVLGDKESFAAFGVGRYQVFEALSLDLRDNAAGEFVLRIFSDQPVYEPSLRFVIEVEDGSGLRQMPIELLLPTDDAVGQKRRLLLSRPNDTLWRIANRTRGDSVTNNQQMLAVQRLNPDAFQSSNINGLKPWNMLSLPLYEEAVTISRRRAAEDVAAQNSSWRLAQALDGVVAPQEREQIRDYGDVRITAVEEPDSDYDESSYAAAEASSIDEFRAMKPANAMREATLEEIPASNELETAVVDVRPEAMTTPPPSTPVANSMNDPEVAADAFDLEELEAQIRKEEAGVFSRLLEWAMTFEGMSILAAIVLAVAIVLLMLRRRTAQQEQALDDVLGSGGEAEDVTPPENQDSEDSTDLSEADEDVYTTRLKLAEAYIEMGDEDGARGMLEEVIADGSPDQQAIARRILDRLENGGR
jgi:FimV-like protein